MDAVIEAAESYIDSKQEVEVTNYCVDNQYVDLIIKSGSVDIVARNQNFVNADTSSYQRLYSDPIKTFDTRDEAIEYLDGLES